jgi:hypothetical protein
MANEKHLKIIKQGVEKWNEWRKDNRGIELDLSRADLSKMNLSKAFLVSVELTGAKLNGADLSYAILSGAFLSNANLSEANLSGAIIREAELRKADLSRANLMLADLTEAILFEANLGQANLGGARLVAANLNGANLIEANLVGANLSRAGVDNAKLSSAKVGYAVFADVDLSKVKGIDMVVHSGPSTIGIDTIYRSKGKIPAVFLRGAGVPDNFIEYMSSLTGTAFEPCMRVKSCVHEVRNITLPALALGPFRVDAKSTEIKHS